MFDQQKKFSYFDYETLTNDFCHLKPLSFHFETSNSKSNFSFDQQIEVKNGKCGLSDIIKLKHSFDPQCSLSAWTGVNSIKLYYGFLLPKQEDNKNNEETVVYTSLYSDRKLQNASIQFGVDRKSQNWFLNANVSASFFESQNKYFLYSKLLYTSSKFKAGLLSIFDYRCRNLQTNNVVLQWKFHPKQQIFLRGEVDGLRNYSLNYRIPSSYFDFIIANYILRPTQTLTLMAEAKYDVNAKKIKNLQSLIVKTFPDKQIKMKINNQADVTLQMQFPLNFGQQSNFNFGIQVADILKSRKISYGFKINANY